MSTSDLYRSPNVSVRSQNHPAFSARVVATVRLAQLVSEGLVSSSPQLRARFTEVIGELVREEGAAPQVGSTPNHEAEIHWLAGGLLAIALIGTDGSLNLYAEDESGREIIERDVAIGEILDDEAASDFSAFLKAISERVLFRI